MDFYDILGWGVIIIGIIAAIAFWPITLIIIIIYFVWKKKKKQEYEERECRIQSLQNAVLDTHRNIELATNQRAELRQKIDDANKELVYLKDRLADTLRFQAFVVAVAHESDLFALPNAIRSINNHIVSQEELVTKLEAEYETLAYQEKELNSSLETKTQEITSLQAIQAAQNSKKR